MNPYDFSDAEMFQHISLCLRVIKRRLVNLGFETEMTHELFPTMEEDGGTYSVISISWRGRQVLPDGGRGEIVTMQVNVSINFQGTTELMEEPRWDLHYIYEHVFTRVVSRMNMRGAGIQKDNQLAQIRENVETLLDGVF